MSSKLVKIGNHIEIPGDELVVNLRIYKSGKRQLEAPAMHPRELCKILSDLQHDLLYASFEPAKAETIQRPDM